MCLMIVALKTLNDDCWESFCLSKQQGGSKMAIADLSLQEIAELRAVLAEWQAQKQQEARISLDQTVQPIRR